MADPSPFPTITDAIATALAEINSDPDPIHAYLSATELGLVGRELLDAARAARGVALGRLRAEQHLTMAQVGEVVRMSKSRASQLISGQGGD